ncbi:MAG TPA: hypothetical protein DEF51_09085, partial [Myxococcales bacterium]|nr:hypothetical protein [Myxococcales bacterium]
SEALSATRAAAAADPSAPAPRMLAAHLWRELGRDIDAAEAAADAADALRARDPERALSLVAMAMGLDPHDPARADALARELAANDRHEASIAVRADAVRRTPDADTRRALLLAAAEQAEMSDRPALAASFLTRAFDAEPHLEVLYEPLDADLAAAGATLERAVLLEEMAAAASEESRATWLTRAAEARLELPGDGMWEAELRARALELDPEDAGNLEAIREQSRAQGDERLLADALERALLRGRWSGAAPQAVMLQELAAIAEEALGATARAAWAWRRLQAIDPSAPAPARQLERLQPALEAHERRMEQLENELRVAIGELRVDAKRRLALHLRDDPARRRRAVGLFRDVFDVEPESPNVADALQRLLRLEGDEYGEARTLAARAEAATNRTERLRTLTRLATLHVMRRDLREAAHACRRVLEELPGHRECSIRLRRAASRLRDRELLREALASEAQMPLPAAERARTLTALALELEIAGSVEEAISCAEAALSADPSSAEAALLVSRHLEVVEQPRAALGMVRAHFGDSPPILEAWARVARDSGEREVMREALDVWAQVAPYDPEPWSMRLTAFPSAESDAALESAIEGALAPEHVTPSLATPVARAVARLGERAPASATRLAIRAADAFGPHGDVLRELAGRLSETTGDHALVRDALERRIATQVDLPRLELLRALAKRQAETNDRAAEARTHLRVLAASPRDEATLARLESLYSETGEVERLLAVL